MILKLGMKHQGEELYKVYINPRSQMSVYRTIGLLVTSSQLNMLLWIKTTDWLTLEVFQWRS